MSHAFSTSSSLAMAVTVAVAVAGAVASVVAVAVAGARASAYDPKAMRLRNSVRDFQALQRAKSAILVVLARGFHLSESWCSGRGSYNRTSKPCNVKHRQTHNVPRAHPRGGIVEASGEDKLEEEERASSIEQGRHDCRLTARHALGEGGYRTVPRVGRSAATGACVQCLF